MSRFLSITNKLFSLRGRMEILDDQGNQAYEARGELSFLSPTWKIKRAGNEAAQVRKKILSLVPTWVVSGDLGEFTVKRKVFSWTRQYYTVGGKLDGAVVKGSIFDLSFEIRSGSEYLARASGKLLSLRDRHNIEVIGEPELFVVVAMVILLLDRKDEQESADN